MKYFLSAFLFLVFACSTAQNKKLDSLKNELNQASVDSVKVNTLNNIARELYMMFELDSASGYLTRALPIAVKSKHTRGEALTHNLIGAIHYYKGENQQAIDSYLRGMKIKEEAGDKKGVAALLGNISGVYTNMGDFNEALKYASQALEIYAAVEDKHGRAVSYNRIGEIYRSLGNYPEASNNYFAGLKNADAIKAVDITSQIYNNLGLLYSAQDKLTEALSYLQKSAAIQETLGTDKGMSGLYHNIGTIYQKTRRYDEAVDNFKKALELNEKIGNKYWMSNNFAGLSGVYADQHRYEEALVNIEKALALRKEIDDKPGMSNAYAGIASIKLALKRTAESREAVTAALEMARKINGARELTDAYKVFAAVDSAQKRFDDAFGHYKLYIAYRDSLLNEENTKKIMETRMQYDFDKKEAALLLEQEKKEAVAKEETKKKNIILAGVCCVLLLVIIFAVFVYRSYLQKQKANILITEQKKLVEEKQKEILDSITYAKRLQEAILPPVNFVLTHLPSSFILYQPKDIVAGDFFWMEVLDKPGFKEHIFIAAADSTGHGVPGAMVSVVCSTALSRAVKEFNLIKPGEILDKTRELVMETFGKSDADVKDGMDISLVCILKTAGSGVQTVLWAGANNPLWYIKNGDMLSLAADKQPIGKTDNAKPFRTHELELAKGDVLYLFTDGYADQFGGPKGKKFKYKPLQDHLGKISLMEPEKQKEDLARTFNEWKGNLEQVDDVCVIGIRF